MDDPFGTDADPALVELFRAETDTHIPALSQGLLLLERGQADEQTIASMMRAAHSIKGAARIVGIDAAVRLSHLMEDCFTAAKENHSILTGDAVDALLQGVDALQRICALQPDAEMTEAWLETVLGQLTAVKEGRIRSTAVDAAAAQTCVEVSPVAAGAQPRSEVRLTLPTDFDDAAAEVVRVRLCQALGEGAVTIRVDFSEVRHVSAMALSVLASLMRDAQRLNPPPTLRAEGLFGLPASLMRVSRLDRMFATDQSVV